MDGELKELLLRYAGCEPESVIRLTAAGSNRVYYRFCLSDGRTVVGVEGTNPDENKAFMTIGRHLSSAGLPVPEILAVSDSGMCKRCNPSIPLHHRSRTRQEMQILRQIFPANRSERRKENILHRRMLQEIP